MENENMEAQTPEVQTAAQTPEAPTQAPEVAAAGAESPVEDSAPIKTKSNIAGWICLGVLLGVILLAIVFALFVNWFSGATGQYLIFGKSGIKTASTSQVVDQNLADKLDEIQQYIDLYYYEDVDEEELQDSLLHGYVDGVGDKYTVYYTPEELEELMISTSGTYYGIGAGLAQDATTNEVTISKVYEGTPSEEAGLLKDDVIVSVGEGDDTVDATSMELSDLVQLIRGEENTTVHLTIYRPSTAETLEFDVTRKNVELPSIASEMLDNNIGYIQVAEFQTNTADQFIAAYKELEAQGMTGLIVDLRDNPGGLLSTVVDMLDFILPEGTVVYTEDKYGNRQDFTSDADCIDMPMVVLVNGNSASASEIFAGAIKDYGYGTLVGTTTFGKGIVQSIYNLSDGDALKVTTARYFTPKGNYIHGVGITPDVELEYEFLGPEDATQYEKQYDNQLQAALQLLAQ